MPCRCSSDTRKFAIKTFYEGNLRFVFVNQLQAVKHESNKQNEQDHGGLPIITITGRKSVCQSIRSLIHPDYSPLEMLNVPEAQEYLPSLCMRSQKP